MNGKLDTFLKIVIFETGKTKKIPAKRVFFMESPSGQAIEVFWTEELGKCLVINGIIQSAEVDNDRLVFPNGKTYDRMLAKYVAPYDQDVFICGGGDLSVAALLARENPCLKIYVADLEYYVFWVARYILGQDVLFRNFNNRIFPVVMDARFMLETLIQKGKKFDVGILDLTDAPCGEETLGFEAFYEEMISNSARCLNSYGRLSIQAGTPSVCEKYVLAREILEPILAKHFYQVEYDEVLVPSFKERAAFVYGLYPRERSRE